MASRLQRRLENQQAQGIDMSPLLDVVFILLIFFIVSTVFVKETGVEVWQTKVSSEVLSSPGEANGVVIVRTIDGKIFAINAGKENLKKVDNFFKNLNVKNFEPYFDAQITLAKIFSLRGLPTSIFINKNGEEFARIIGFIDFDNKKFIDWLKNYN